MVTNVLPAALIKLVDHFPGAAVLKQGELLYVNQAVEELTGRAREDLSSESQWRAILSPTDQNKLFNRNLEEHPLPPSGLNLRVSLSDANETVFQLEVQIFPDAFHEIWFLQPLPGQKAAVHPGGNRFLATKTEELAYAVNLLLDRHYRLKQIRHRDALVQQALELHSRLLHSAVQLMAQHHQGALVSLAESMSRLVHLMDETTDYALLEQQIQLLEDLLRQLKEERT